MINLKFKKFRNLTVFLIFLWILITILILSSDKNPFKILLFSDVHLDWFYQEKSDFFENRCHKYNENYTTKKYGRLGCYTPVSLFNLSIIKMKKFIKNPNLIIFGGDSIAYPSTISINDTSNALDIIFSSISKNYPKIPFLFVPGNTDFYPSYSLNKLDKKNFLFLSKKLENFLNNDEINSFQKGGYYYKDFINFNLRIIILNSIIYSSSYRDDPIIEDPFEQFLWLNLTLIEAKRKKLKIGLFLHIFPCQNSCDCWRLKYTNIFNQIINLNQPDFVFNFHTHLNRFRFFNLQNKLYYFISNPSISPSHENFPTFRKIIWNNNKLINIEDFIFDEINWKKKIDFKNDFYFDDLTQNSIDIFYKNLCLNKKLFLNYIKISTSNGTLNKIIKDCNSSNCFQIINCIGQGLDILNKDKNIVCN